MFEFYCYTVHTSNNKLPRKYFEIMINEFINNIAIIYKNDDWQNEFNKITMVKGRIAPGHIMNYKQYYISNT